MSVYNIIFNFGPVFGNTTTTRANAPNFVPDVQRAVEALLGPTVLSLENLARPRQHIGTTGDTSSTTNSSATCVEPPMGPSTKPPSVVHHSDQDADTNEDSVSQRHLSPEMFPLRQSRSRSASVLHERGHADPDVVVKQSVPSRLRQKGSTRFTDAARDWFISTWKTALVDAKRNRTSLSATSHSKVLFKMGRKNDLRIKEQTFIAYRTNHLRKFQTIEEGILGTSLLAWRRHCHEHTSCAQNGASRITKSSCSPTPGPDTRFHLSRQEITTFAEQLIRTRARNTDGRDIYIFMKNKFPWRGFTTSEWKEARNFNAVEIGEVESVLLARGAEDSDTD